MIFSFSSCSIIFIVTLFGTVIMALNINYFQSITHLNDNDKHTLNLIQRLEFKDNIGNLAVSYFKNNYMYVIQKRKYFRGEINNNDEQRNIMIQKARNKFFLEKNIKRLFIDFKLNIKWLLMLIRSKKKLGI